MSFKSERIYRTQSFVLNGTLDDVFVLFRPIKEKDWADGWNPRENGNHLNENALEKMYSQELKDWEKAINYYQKTGKCLKE